MYATTYMQERFNEQGTTVPRALRVHAPASLFRTHDEFIHASAPLDFVLDGSFIQEGSLTCDVLLSVRAQAPALQSLLNTASAFCVAGGELPGTLSALSFRAVIEVLPSFRAVAKHGAASPEDSSSIRVAGKLDLAPVISVLTRGEAGYFFRGGLDLAVSLTVSSDWMLARDFFLACTVAKHGATAAKDARSARRDMRHNLGGSVAAAANRRTLRL